MITSPSWKLALARNLIRPLAEGVKLTDLDPLFLVAVAARE